MTAAGEEFHKIVDEVKRELLLARRYSEEKREREPSIIIKFPGTPELLGDGKHEECLVHSG